MTVSATLRQTKSINEDGEYTISSEVIAATDMPVEVFVYKSSSGLYDHVATMRDMMVFSTEAEVNRAFYRQSGVIQSFSTPSGADDAAEVHEARVNSLVLEFALGGASYDGSYTDTTLDGS